jgi:O-antigen ligase
MTAIARRLSPAAAGPFTPGTAAFLVLFAGLGAVGVVSPVLALGAVLGLLFVGLVMWNLAAGITVFAVLTFVSRLPGTGGAGVTVVKLAGAVLTVGWLVTLIRRRETPFLLRDYPVIGFALIGFELWAISSALWATNPKVAVVAASRYAQNFLLVFIAYSALREQKHFRWLLLTFVAAAVFSAVTGSSQAPATAITAEGSSSRLAGRFGAGDPNALASLLVPAIVFVGFFLVTERRMFTRVALLAGGGSLLVALFQTESRGGLVALTVTCCLAPLLGGGRRSRALVAAALVAAIGVSYFAFVATPASRDRVTRLSAEESSGRNDLWRVGLAIAADHPMLGVGSGNFTQVSPQYAERNFDIVSINYIVDTPKVTHNMYLNILDELGIPGLVMFALAVGGAVAAAAGAVRILARRMDVEAEMFGRALIVAISAMLTASFFFSGEYQKQLWLLLGAAAALASFARPRSHADA